MKAFLIFLIVLNGTAALFSLASACYLKKPVEAQYDVGHYVFRTIWHLALGAWALWLLAKGAAL